MLARLMGLATVDPSTLRRRMQEERIAIFDVNSRASWLAARIPGAHRLDPATFGANDLPEARDQELVFDRSNPFCRKAPQAAKRALKMGYHEVRVLSAGIMGWVAAGLPTESGG